MSFNRTQFWVQLISFYQLLSYLSIMLQIKTVYLALLWFKTLLWSGKLVSKTDSKASSILCLVRAIWKSLMQRKVLVRRFIFPVPTSQFWRVIPDRRVQPYDRFVQTERVLRRWFWWSHDLIIKLLCFNASYYFPMLQWCVYFFFAFFTQMYEISHYNWKKNIPDYAQKNT